MAKWSNVLLVSVVTLCLLLFLETQVEARGGRGGGGRGGSRGGSRSSRSRSYSRSTSRGSSYRGSSSSSGFRAGGLRWKQAGTVGFIYGYTRYSTRHSYRRYPNREPTICTNKYDYKHTNGTYYSYFICPKYNEPDSYKYCCGPKDRQKCCSFWQDSGRAAGTIIGILLFLGISFCCCYCCCCRKRGDDPSRFQSFKQRPPWKGESGSGRYNYKPTHTSDASPMTQFQPQPVPYTVPGHEDNQPQPNYPVNPVMPPAYAPQPGYPPQTDPAYPPQPGYPPQTDPAYPVKPGFAPQPDPAYPAQPGYAPQPDPAYPAQPGYAPQPDPAYPAQPGYAPQPDPAYPAQPGFPGAAPGPGGPGGPGYPPGPGDGSVPYPVNPNAPYPGGPPQPGAPPPGMPYPMAPNSPYPTAGDMPSAPPPGYSDATRPHP